jgi:hypothetical protein
MEPEGGSPERQDVTSAAAQGHGLTSSAHAVPPSIAEQIMPGPVAHQPEHAAASLLMSAQQDGGQDGDQENEESDGQH